MRRLLSVLLACLLSCSFTFAGTKDTESWENLKQLRPGDKIEVIDQSMKSLRGTLFSVSEEAITLHSKNNTFTVNRADVLRVSVRDAGKRTRNMLLGAAIGAGTGLAITLPFQVQQSNEGNSIAGIVAGVTAGASGAGLALGATTGNRTVYRAAKRKPSGPP